MNIFRRSISGPVTAGMVFLLSLILASACSDSSTSTHGERDFDPETDLLSLHYDHAPDKDDGHSAVADRTILQTRFGREWIMDHVVPVSGAYGQNAAAFNPDSDTVMDSTWNDTGGWFAAAADPVGVRTELVRRWTAHLDHGGDIWVKEGGQSDITADVVAELRAQHPSINTRSRIHVVQHSDWNEEQTSDEALEYTKRHTDYIRIRDANAYLNIEGGNAQFEEAAVMNPDFGAAWRAAFDYYDPDERLDFSDTGELMHILGLGELSIDDFREIFLDP